MQLDDSGWRSSLGGLGTKGIPLTGLGSASTSQHHKQAQCLFMKHTAPVSFALLSKCLGKCCKEIQALKDG